MIKKSNKQRGYTILETMVSVGLFLIVITYGMTALLNANLVHHKSRALRSIMDSMNFITEDMSKNMRTGSLFHCYDTAPDVPVGLGSSEFSTPRSCSTGQAISFELGDASDDPWIYKIENGQIFKATDSPYNADSFVQLSPIEVLLNNTSQFSVLGAESFSDDNQQQPLILIRLSGTITYKGTITQFNLQTSASQRVIDI